MIANDETSDERPGDPLERARHFRMTAEEMRQQARNSTLISVRRSYLKMARTNEIMADAAEAEAQLRPRTHL